MVRKIKLRKIALMSLEFSARKSPDEEVIVGTKVFRRIEIYERIKNGDKELEKIFLKPLIKAFKERPELLTRTLKVLGLES